MTIPPVQRAEAGPHAAEGADLARSAPDGLIILLDCGFLWLDAGFFGGAGRAGNEEGIFVPSSPYLLSHLSPSTEASVTVGNFLILVGCLLPRYYEKCPPLPYLVHPMFLRSSPVDAAAALAVHIRRREFLPCAIHDSTSARVQFACGISLCVRCANSARSSFSARRDFEYEDDASVIASSLYVETPRRLRYQGIKELSAPLDAQITVLLKNLRNLCYHELLSHAAPNTSHSFVSQDTSGFCIHYYN
ncbi:hypothetical protein C8R44DRAFT_746262 [Mycena epipterygia]|nr:hypothetical protein C8R44DRAFT_746262 [Mycena epipterygia]